MELEEVKKYLRVDYDDEDDIIRLELEAAKQYIINAVGKYDESDPLVRLLTLVLVSSMFQERSYSISVNDKNSYTVRSMIVQLQLDEYGDDD